MKYKTIKIDGDVKKELDKLKGKLSYSKFIKKLIEHYNDSIVLDKWTKQKLDEIREDYSYSKVINKLVDFFISGGEPQVEVIPYED